MLDLTLKCDALSLTITSKLTQERCQAQPVARCDFVTTDVLDAAERIVLFTIHAIMHNNTSTTAAKPEKGFQCQFK